MDHTEHEHLLKVAFILEELGKKVAEISIKIDKITENHIMETNTRLAVAEEKVKRLESIIYGTICAILAQLIGLIILWVKK